MIRKYYGLVGSLTAVLSSGSTVMLVNTSLSGAISENFVNGTDTTYLAISVSGAYEIVKVTNVSGNALTVQREQDGTDASAFPLGARIEFIMPSSAIVEEIEASEPIVNITITGEGIATASEPTPGNFVVNVPAPNFTPGNGIAILGVWPDITITYVQEDNECCGDQSGSGGSGITDITFGGIVEGFVSGPNASISVANPSFNSGPGINVTGTWPNYTISTTGGDGTVTIVNEGAGISVTGNPNVNPTINIANTGVTPGTYGDLEINSRGQIVSVGAGFDPISSITPVEPINAIRAGGDVTISVDAGAIGVPGILALADETDPFNPADNTTAASPAVVAQALSSLVLPQVNGASAYIGEADADYTNTISGSAVAINIAAGEKAIVYAEVTMLDPALPTDPVLFGMAVFSATPTRIKANRKVNQCTQNMSFTVDGPINSNLAIVTTAIPAGATVVSYSLWIMTS